MLIIKYKYRVDSHSSLYLQNTTDCAGRIILFCCIHPQLKGWSMKILSDIKPVRGAKDVGECCYRGLVESIIITGTTIWWGTNTQAEIKALHRVVKPVEEKIRTVLPTMDTIYLTVHTKRNIERRDSPESICAAPRSIILQQQVPHTFAQ